MCFILNILVLTDIKCPFLSTIRSSHTKMPNQSIDQGSTLDKLLKEHTEVLFETSKSHHITSHLVMQGLPWTLSV